MPEPPPNERNFHIELLSLTQSFDYMLLLPLEVKYIWPSRWSHIKVLYIIMRYLPFFSILCIVLADIPGRRPDTCWKLVVGYSYGLMIGILTAEAILTLRVWAIYLHDRKLGFTFLFVYSSFSISVLGFVGTLLPGVKFATLPLPNAPTCFIVASSRKLSVFWFLLAGYDAFQCLLLGRRAIIAFKYGGKTRLSNFIYKDGIMYYMYTMLMSVLGMILILTLPPEYTRLTVGPTHVIHTALTSRVVLHTRRLASSQVIMFVSSSGGIQTEV
ncbi:hypothetical protein AMATHDRAFT_70597 [Amanita thiersii Skay4041]|uniref:DUF6533 domain-containing protein n=1 Tax=Amanita thiersii Skay4041 TaxID=703135 RepID=A0A2A9NEI0_9AGAR|nr:hypothetical protein AMATHDRAFT_70597 [Amanita thiersii Skay4041]